MRILDASLGPQLPGGMRRPEHALQLCMRMLLQVCDHDRNFAIARYLVITASVDVGISNAVQAGVESTSKPATTPRQLRMLFRTHNLSPANSPSARHLHQLQVEC